MEQPTQAIGAVALDTTTTPSTIYVGTGEGNGSIDSLYGAGIFKSANLGQTWTSLDNPTGNFRPRRVHLARDRYHHYAGYAAHLCGHHQRL